MALQLVIGNSGAGKTYRVYEDLIRESIEAPEKQYYVIVPEQFTMQTQKDLVMMHPAKGIMNIDVLSFNRLAYRILEETGGNRKQVLDDEGKNLILRRIAGMCEPKLRVLGGNLKRTGYISEMKSVISEFTQYDINPKALEEILVQAGEESYLSYKLKDIQIVYEAFREFLSEKYITGEELLDVLCQVLPDSAKMRGSVVVLDGFTGFTPIQTRLLGKMFELCEKVIVTVTLGAGEDAYRYVHPYQMFSISKQMVSAVLNEAKQHRTEVLPQIRLDHPSKYRFQESPSLAFLEENIFRHRGKVYEGKPEEIKLHVCRNVMSECEFAAQTIENLIRTKGMRYREIAVITADPDVYADSLEKVFAHYEIPLFLDHKRSVLLNSFVEYIRSLLGIQQKQFTQESVFRFLRTGLVSGDDVEFTPEVVDELENYVMALGIKGYAHWQSPWFRRAKETTVEDLERLNHWRVVLVEKLEPFLYVLRKKQKTVRDITEALWDFLDQEDMQMKMQQYEKKFQEQGELVLAKEYAQIYRIVMELFEKFVELLGGEMVSLDEYCELLDAGFAEAKVGVIPPSPDQVVAGDAERTRLKDIKALLFLGVNDVNLPGKLERNGLISEYDREVLTKGNVVLAPGAKEKAFVQKFYLYQNLTKPSKLLILSYSRQSREGKALRPAYLVQELFRMFPELSLEDEEKRMLSEQEMIPKSGISYLVKGLQNLNEGGFIGEGFQMWEELLCWYLREETWREKAENLLEANQYHKPDLHLEEETAQELYGSLDHTSVTRLERFCACAFSHYLTYGLRLKERQEFEFRPLDWGNLLHSALELFSKKVQKTGKLWTMLEEKERDELVEACVDETITDYGNTILYSSARNEYLITRLKQMMARTIWALTKQMERGAFRPSGYEVNFYGGKIDRVDTCERDDKIYVKIIDYKTGTQSFDLAALYHGLQMQLVVYMDAAMTVEEKRHPDQHVVPAGIFYYKIKDPIVSREEDMERLEEAILKELRLDGIVNSDDAVLRLIDEEMKPGTSSSVIPAGRKKDGMLTWNSKAVSEEGFGSIRKYTKKKIALLRRQIAAGEIDAAPYEFGSRTACDYCQFRNICRFEPGFPGYLYRRLPQLSAKEVLERMREEE